MTIKTSTGSSKTELSSRGKHPFKVYIYSLKLLAKSMGIPNAHAGNVVANFSVSQLLGYTVRPIRLDETESASRDRVGLGARAYF